MKTIIFTNYNHLVTDQCGASFSELQIVIIHNVMTIPQKQKVPWSHHGHTQVPTKAEAGSKVSSSVNKYLSSAELRL